GSCEDAQVSAFGERLREVGSRQQTPKAAETLEFCEDAHPSKGEHLRRDPQKASGFGKTGPLTPAKMLTEDAHVSAFVESQHSCGFGPPETPKVLTSPTCSEREYLHAPTAGVTCCECGTAIAERLATSWGGRPCHRKCGEAAWRREKRDLIARGRDER